MDIKTIKHIAFLARIKLTEKEETSMKDKLSSILDYINKLNQVNTDGVEPIYQATGLVNSMREDKQGEGSNKELNNELVSQAPDKENGFVRVKSILNK